MFGTTIGAGRGNNIPNQITQVSKKQKKSKSMRYHDYIADYGGCGHWRMLWPQMIINSTQKAIGSNTSAMILDDSFYRDIASVRLQRQVTPTQLKFVRFLREKADRFGFKILYEIDDIFVLEDIPKYNAFRKAYEDPELQKSAKEVVSIADLVTVPSQTMKEYYSKYNSNVHVLQNYPPKFWLDGYYDQSDVVSSLASATRPRIVYSGSTAHYDVKNKNKGVDDFSHLIDLVKNTTDKYEWIFIGGLPPPLHQLYKSGKIVLHEWCNIYNLPAFLSSLHVNAFIAPLYDNAFNQCKSDIKIIEAGGLGVPCICQDIVTYANSPLKFTTGDDLADQLNLILNDVSLYTKYSREYNEITNQRWLDDNYEKHLKLFGKK